MLLGRTKLKFKIPVKPDWVPRGPAEMIEGALKNICALVKEKSPLLTEAMKASFPRLSRFYADPEMENIWKFIAINCQKTEWEAEFALIAMCAIQWDNLAELSPSRPYSVVRKKTVVPLSNACSKILKIYDEYGGQKSDKKTISENRVVKDIFSDDDPQALEALKSIRYLDDKLKVYEPNFYRISGFSENDIPFHLFETRETNTANLRPFFIKAMVWFMQTYCGRKYADKVATLTNIVFQDRNNVDDLGVDVDLVLKSAKEMNQTSNKSTRSQKV